MSRNASDYPFKLRVDEEIYAILDPTLKKSVLSWECEYPFMESHFFVAVTSEEVDLMMDSPLKDKIISQLVSTLYQGTDLSMTFSAIFDFVERTFGQSVLCKLLADNRKPRSISWVAEDVDKLLPRGFFLKYQPVGADLAYNAEHV